MAVKSNKLTPVLVIVAFVIVGSVMVMRQNNAPTAAPMAAAPLPKTAGADEDTPSETLATVVAANKDLRADIQDVLRANQDFSKRLERLEKGTPSGTSSAGAVGGTSNDTDPAPVDVFKPIGDAIDSVTGLGSNGAGGGHRPVGGSQDLGLSGGSTAYKVVPPMGYTTETTQHQGKMVTRYVRVAPDGTQSMPSAVIAAQAAQAAQATQPATKQQPVAYFTLPENSTLAGVTAMTSLIGRVPVNGRVTDPMQFKAMVGRDNLAANGWELPEDLAGMIVTGVAVGDMALSCTEGKIRSMTFVFNDGAIHTVSARRAPQTQAGAGVTAIATNGSTDLGFISDLYGNPCIQGKFVTNAPAYLTDIIGAKGLGVAAEALAQAQTTTMASSNGTTSSITGNAGSFALGRMGSGATDELVRWLTERLKSSFDAVVTPAGQQLVVHLDRQIEIDKPANPRKIVHRTQSPNVLSGARYGLE